ncbi:MAG: CCA tRNA nucleotidyltransferase [Candidatus Omnitrophota bacterium]|nr:MAG: CCA tRNA nucleotidyltransferase [Candidatus Omnitrophota bacterium]
MVKKRQLASGIVRKLRSKGFSAYFVGGCVRDMVMRKAPKDFDIATSAKVSQIRKIFPGQTHSVGAQFGTLLVIRNDMPFQVSTFRSKRRKALLSISEDVKMRDFTINGLAYEPIAKKIIDLVGGRSDIRRKKIRCIGEASSRFKEDPLRLVRAVRFAVTLGFSIEDKTLQAIGKMAAEIKKASLERIRDELVLIFTGKRPSLGLKLLDETGLLRYILPEVDKLKGVEQPRAFHPEGDVFAHTLLMLKKLKSPSLVLVFACLLHDIGKPATFEVAERIRFSGHDKLGAEMSDRILKRLRFSNRDREDIVACVENHMRIMEAPKMREATLKRLFARPTFEEELALHRIDCIASHKDLTIWRFLRSKYKEVKKEPAIPRPLLSGYELIKIGFTPGPIFGKIHREMIDMQLEGKLKSKAQAKKWVRDNFLKEKRHVQAKA